MGKFRKYVKLIVPLASLALLMYIKTTKIRDPGENQLGQMVSSRGQAVILSPPDLKKVTTTRCQNTLRTLSVKYETTHDGITAVWIHDVADLTTRIEKVNTMLTTIRGRIIKNYGNQEFQFPDNKTTWYDGDKPSYFREVAGLCHVIPIAVPWLVPTEGAAIWRSFDDKANLLVQAYYDWVAEEDLCQWVLSGHSKHRWDFVHNHTCNTNVATLKKPVSLKFSTINTVPYHKKYDKDGYNINSSPPTHVTYLFIAMHGIITYKLGQVITRDVTLLSTMCFQHFRDIPERVDKIPLYDEVFVMSQFLGNFYFHLHAENTPRLMPYLTFLKENPDIMIHGSHHTGTTARTVKMLGIDPKRVISGWARGKIIYIPEATYCGTAHVVHEQLLSKEYRSIIHHKFNASERTSLLMISRSRKRQFKENNTISNMLEKIAERHNLRYEVFPDHPSPPMDETMRMFNRAVMIVAGHGAGLSNMIFSEPGTYIIEVICDPPRGILCFTHLAHVLGHRWHGLMAERGCEEHLDFDVTKLERVVKTHISDAAKLVTNSDAL